jgi:hypothetical protein
MVGFIDQRPDSKDTLRQLVTKLRTPSSVPFGNKVASAGEGVTFVTSAGDSLRWDGDTLAAFDTRMEDAVKTVQASRANLEATKTRLEEAERRIQEAEAAGANVDTEAIATNVQRRLVQSKTPWIDGRNLIVPGTIDTRQLNVTGELAANIVRSMSAETKKLVVTEEAVLNNLTVIENIVTPELVTKKIKTRELAAEMIAGGLIQTSTQERQGIKLNNAGISAFNTAGEQTVKIDANGTDNYIRGVFSTAADHKAGLTIRTTQGPISGGESIIEMRPLDATQRAPIGIIRMSPQGALQLGMKRFGAADSETRGFFVDPQGGVNITDSLRVNRNMRLDGLWSMTKNMWVRSVGPYRVESGKWVEVRFSWPELEQQPYLIAQPFGSQALVTTMTGVNRSGGLLRIYNIGRDVATDVWTDVYLMPFNRSTPAP